MMGTRVARDLLFVGAIIVRSLVLTTMRKMIVVKHPPPIAPQSVVTMSTFLVCSPSPTMVCSMTSVSGRIATTNTTRPGVLQRYQRVPIFLVSGVTVGQAALLRTIFRQSQ